MVLRERYRAGGLIAVIESMDLGVVNQMRFDRPPIEIRTRLNRAAEKVKVEIEKLRPDVDIAVAAYKKRIDDIQRTSEDRALDGLGPDGRRLKALIVDLEGA